MVRFRWRTLTPEQAVEIREAWRSGARGVDLAAAYGVHVRAIYRAIHRAEEPFWTVRVAEYAATFALENGYPVQLTPWVAT